ncbi:recombinase family protein [Cytobacillus sp. Hm23]
MNRLNNLDVFIYLRKSRKDIEEEKNAAEDGSSYDTLSRHRNNLLKLAKNENHNIVEIYEEIISGESVAQRPKMQEMLREVESGLVEAVLVMDIDRLGRGDMLDQGILDRAFRYSNTKIITPSNTYDPEDESWELTFGIKSLISREELKAITRRLQGGRRDKALAGKSISKRPPFGYLRDENLKLYPDPENAWVVKKIFEMMTEGKGRNAVAQELDKLGVAPPFRDTWAPSTISSMIKNEVYIGHIIWGKIKHVKRNGKYYKKKLPRNRWIIKENAHEPIVTKELFEKANEAYSNRWRPNTEPTKKLANPLAGLLQCEICGYTMWYVPRKDRPSHQIRCVQPQCKGKQKGASLHLVEDKILNGLKEYIEQFAINDDYNQNRNEEISDIPFKQNAIEKKKKMLDELKVQKSNLHDLLERGIYDIDTFMERQHNLVDRVKKIEEEINLIEKEIIDEKLMKKNKIEYVPTIKKVLEGYHHTNDIEAKNQLLKKVLEKVTYLRKPEWTTKDQFDVKLYLKT